MTISSVRVTRRKFLTGATVLAASAAESGLRAGPPSSSAATSTRYVLHFAQPAATWPDALPVGNGRLGAMVFGGPAMDRVQLNEESIWDGELRDRNNPRAREAVPRIRELLFAGKIAEAEQMAVSDMLSIPQRMPCYQTLGDLHLDFSPIGIIADTKVEEYRLELNLETAIVTTTFIHQGVRYTREVFSSAPDQVIVIRLTASRPGMLSFHAKLDRPANFSSELLPGNRVSLSGQALPVNDNPGLPVKERQTGVRFYAELLVLKEGGEFVEAIQDLPPAPIHIAHANSVTLLLDCATSYRYPSDSASPSRFNEGDPAAMQKAVARNLNAARTRSYADLRARHVADHQRYFRRADLQFGKDINSAIPTDQRIQRIRDGGEDVTLLPIYFQFGRYMLISSSRPGTLAANLQGIWNDSVDPPWGSKYTVNINAEMNYWLAERANLADCHLPLIDLQDTTRGPGSVTARKYYDASGIVVHHNTDIWGDSGPIDGLGGGIWAMGAAWLSLHAWDHYEFGGDLRFLRDQAYPLLRDNAIFLLDYQTTAPAGTPYAGELVTGPSCSPENKYKLPDGRSFNLCMGPTMDLSITRAVLTRLIQASEALGNPADDAQLLQRAKVAIPRIPSFRITHDGRLQEWPGDYADQEPGHRHISHLFGLFPDDQITLRNTPDLAEAARVTLNHRLAAGGGSTGWSRAWIINCMARLEDGEAAYASVVELLRRSTRRNLFDVCGIKENSYYQIDGNLGGATGLVEMLLQSHAGVIRLLPALPNAWPNGSFRGLRARSGIEVDLAWQNLRATRAVLHAASNTTIRLAAPKGQRLVSLIAGRESPRTQTLADGTIQVSLKRGSRYIASFA